VPPEPSLMNHQPRKFALGPLIHSAVAVVCVAAGAISFTVWGLRVDTLNDASESTGRAATLLADKTADFVKSVDFLLSEVQEKVRRSGPDMPADFRSICFCASG
jgi:hypothetical protein